MQSSFQVRFHNLQAVLSQSLSPATLTSIGIHALLLLALPSWLANSSFSTAIVQRPVGVIELTPEEAALLPNANPVTPDLSQLFGQAPPATGITSPIAPPPGTPDLRNLFAGLPTLPGLSPLAPLPVPFPADSFVGLPAPPPIIPLDWYAPPPVPAQSAVGSPQRQAGPVEQTVIVSDESLDYPPGEVPADAWATGATATQPPSSSPEGGNASLAPESPAVAAEVPGSGRASDLGGPLAIARADLQTSPTPVDRAAAPPLPPDPLAANSDYVVDTQPVATLPTPVTAPPVTVIVPYPASACPIAAAAGYTTVETDAQGQIIAGPVIDLGHPDLNAAARSAVLAQPRSLGAAVYQYDLSVSGQTEVCGG